MEPKRYDGGSTYSDDAAMKPKGEGRPATGISFAARKGLQFGSVQVQADPYTAALPGSAPYPLAAEFNRVVAPTYKGIQNLDGGNIQQYSYSITSQLLHVFDYVYMRLNANYNYVPMNPAEAEGDNYPGRGLIDEMRRAIAEAGSILGATTFTSLAFNSYAIETDLPMGSAQPITIQKDGQDIQVFTEFADVFYGFSTMYQLVLQAARMPLKSYNSFRLKMGTLLRTGFQREVPQLNSFFGLMKKSSFVTTLHSIAKSFEGEYFDTEFAKVIDLLSVTPSRRSNSLFDPVLELGLSLSHPTKFKIHILNSNGDAFVGDPIDLMSIISAPVLGTTGESTIFEIQTWLENTLAAESTAYWARSTQYNSIYANDRFNQIKYYFDAVNTILTRFKIVVSDLREACDVLARTGVIRWKKGFIPFITKEDDALLFENRFIVDVYKAAMSSAAQVRFNDRTKRWDTFTMWNMYDGIPAYDTYSGGAFLTFSFKQFITGDDPDSTIIYIPKVFSGQKNGNYDVYAYMCSRDGVELQISRGGTEVISDNPILARLAPLRSQSSETIRIPSVTIPRGTVTDIEGRFSLAYKTLAQIFTTAKVSITENGVETVSEYALDPDVIAIYQIELEDITNEALNYARSHCVINGSASDDGVIGFNV